MFKFLKDVKNPLGFTRFSVGIPTGVEKNNGQRSPIRRIRTLIMATNVRIL